MATGVELNATTPTFGLDDDAACAPAVSIPVRVRTINGIVSFIAYE